MTGCPKGTGEYERPILILVDTVLEGVKNQTLRRRIQEIMKEIYANVAAGLHDDIDGYAPSNDLVL